MSVISRLLRQGFTVKRSPKARGERIELFKDGKRVAYAQVRDSSDGDNLLEMHQRHVEPAYRQQKLGTALYEIALAVACSEGKFLVSDINRSQFEEAFWRKQVSKKRASCVEMNRRQYANVYEAPLHMAVAEACKGSTDADCAQKARKKILSTLPDAPYWPCLRYALDKANCGRSLEGLPKSKTRRR